MRTPGWEVISDGIANHVVPVLDCEPHFITPDCHCHPDNHPETTGNLVVHNSFDGREKTEPDREVIS